MLVQVRPGRMSTRRPSPWPRTHARTHARTRTHAHTRTHTPSPWPSCLISAQHTSASSQDQDPAHNPTPTCEVSQASCATRRRSTRVTRSVRTPPSPSPTLPALDILSAPIAPRATGGRSTGGRGRCCFGGAVVLLQVCEVLCKYRVGVGMLGAPLRHRVSIFCSVSRAFCCVSR